MYNRLTAALITDLYRAFDCTVHAFLRSVWFLLQKP